VSCLRLFSLLTEEMCPDFSESYKELLQRANDLRELYARDSVTLWRKRVGYHSLQKDKP